MYRYQVIRRLILTFALAIGFLISGCGGAGGGNGADGHGEFVHLRVFNAYPGSQSLSLYGPAGTIEPDLAYGAKSEDYVAVDRNLGTEFTVVLDGAPQSFDAQESLFSLYPGETGTLVISRRNDTSVTTRLYRHIQSISNNCRLVVGNSLALADGDLGTYGFLIGWDFQSDGIDAAGFRSNDPRLEERPNFLSDIERYPYFFLVETEDEEEDEIYDGLPGLGFVWVGNDQAHDRPRIDFSSGSMLAHPPTHIVNLCLEELEEPEDASDAEAMRAYELEVAECKKPRRYNPPVYGSGLQGGEILHYTPATTGSPATCDGSFRIFSDFGNIFEGRHGDGNRIDFDVEMSSGDHFFAILYGHPIDPRLETWISSDFSSGGGFAGFD